jgi:hypothetical protein
MMEPLRFRRCAILLIREKLMSRQPQDAGSRWRATPEGCGADNNARGASVPRFASRQAFGGPPGFPQRPDCLGSIPQSSNWLGRKDISGDVKKFPDFEAGFRAESFLRSMLAVPSGSRGWSSPACANRTHCTLGSCPTRRRRPTGTMTARSGRARRRASQSQQD